MAYHAFPPNVGLIRFVFVDDKKSFMSNDHFVQLCEKVPLIGMLVVGHAKFRPQALDVDEGGMLTTRIFQEMEIMILDFMLFLQGIRAPDTLVIHRLDMYAICMVAEKLCASELVRDVLKRKEMEYKIRLQSELDDVDKVYDWKTLGPCTLYMPTDFEAHEREGWSLVFTRNVRKAAVFYTLRRLKN